MATYTEHYNLIKPALNDKVNINNLNDNADIIDTALNNKVNTSDTQDITTSANNCMMSDGVTSVEALMSDKTIAEGIQPTLVAGQNYGSGCYYFKIGCFIYLYISVVFNSAPTNVNIFTLPEGYKPLLGGEITVSGGESYNAKAQCIIDANGYITVTSADKYVSGSGVLLAKAFN